MQDNIQKLQSLFVVPRQSFIAHCSSEDVSCHSSRGVTVPAMIDRRGQSRLEIPEMSQDSIQGNRQSFFGHPAAAKSLFDILHIRNTVFG